MLRLLNPQANAHTISIDVPHSPYPIIPDQSTVTDVETLLLAHDFDITSLSTVDYYPIALPPRVRAFLSTHSIRADLNGQVIRAIARKSRPSRVPVYPSSIYPDGKPVGVAGALSTWLASVPR